MRRLIAGFLALVLMATGAAADVWNAETCVQRQMNALGYGPLTDDGRIGPATRAALARYEAVAGTLPARALTGKTAIIHCRKLGLRHPAARRVWPVGTEPFQVVTQAGMPGSYGGMIRNTMVVTLKFLKDDAKVEIAAPFVVALGEDRHALAKLTETYLPQGYTRSGTAYDLKQTCAGPRLRGLAYPGLILLCLPKDENRPKSQVFDDIRWVASHELVHEVQWQLTGLASVWNDRTILAERGPDWLIEGAADTLSNRRMTLDDAVWYLRQAQDLPKDASRDLRKLELYASGRAAKERLYVLGAGAASQLALRKSGVPGLIAFYDRLGEGVPWLQAFAQTFGITPDVFHDRWKVLSKSR
jgi:hypothetical protein